MARLTTKGLTRELDRVLERFAEAAHRGVALDPDELDALADRLEEATNELRRLLNRANVNARGDAWETDLLGTTGR